jgi:nicotinic acid mononucleotide adenylyltransferase
MAQLDCVPLVTLKCISLCCKFSKRELLWKHFKEEQKDCNVVVCDEKRKRASKAKQTKPPELIHINDSRDSADTSDLRNRSKSK